MNTINTTAAPFETVSFDAVTISDMNPRAVTSDDSIARLADNIRAVGLIHPLAGIKTPEGKIEIVAGGRRFRALALCQDDPRFHSFPVHIAPDEETALAWASAENANREALHPADEIRDYGNLAEKGADVATIATAYGVTEPHVYRRLALAHLPAPVLDALRTDAINLSAAAAFTVSDDESRTLTVLEQVKGENYSHARIKSMLKPEAIRHTDRRARFVGSEAYAAAGGRVSADLFTDDQTFDDPIILEEAFAIALEDAAQTIKTEGWAWVKAESNSHVGYYEIEALKAQRIYPTEGVLSEEEAARYDELAELAENEILSEVGADELATLQTKLDGEFTGEEKALSGVLIYVDAHGDLKRHEGLILPDQKKEAVNAGLLSAPNRSTDEDQPKSPISNALRDDLRRVKQGAEQQAALRDPELLIDLLAYQLSHDLMWRSPLAIGTNRVPTMPTTEVDGYNLSDDLTAPPRDMFEVKDIAASFRAFRKKGSDHVKAELARNLAQLYHGGDQTLAAMVAKTTKPNTREVWTPTKDNFFKRVSGDYLGQLWADLLALPSDHPTITAFHKLKKAEKAQKLHDLFNDPDAPAIYDLDAERIEALNAWLPDGM